jgi:hypothetical protein
MFLSGIESKAFAAKLVSIYAVATCILLAITCYISPRFSYALDDAYIHLALAQNIAHGTYGINPGETTSPSSSVIWPFLLAPFSQTAYRAWVPFFYNVIFSIATCALVGAFLGPQLLQRQVGRVHSWLVNSPRYWRLGKWVLPALAAFAFLPTLVRIPVACQQIARQQYQMHRFSHDFVKKNVAVEDLGWVAFDTDGKYYLLDLVGLGSNDTLRFRNIEKNAAWLDDVTRRHDIRLVMIYHPAFPDVPSRWRKLGVLTQTPHWLNGGAASDQVTLYATNPQDFAAMRSELQRFSQTLPAGVWLEDLSR